MPFTISGEWVPEKAPKKNKPPIKVVKQRRGQSIVTQVLNLPLEPNEIKALCSNFKQKLGCGGSVKDEVIELQGDKVEVVRELLRQKNLL